MYKDFAPFPGHICWISKSRCCPDLLKIENLLISSQPDCVYFFFPLAKVVIYRRYLFACMFGRLHFRMAAFSFNLCNNAVSAVGIKKKLRKIQLMISAKISQELFLTSISQVKIILHSFCLLIQLFPSDDIMECNAQNWNHLSTKFMKLLILLNVISSKTMSLLDNTQR